MQMMGLKIIPYWASWLAYYTFVNTVISFVTCIILGTNVTNSFFSWILFLAFWLFGQSLFGLMLITQSIFSSARAAAIVSSLIFFGSSSVNYAISDDDTSTSSIMWACLSPTTAIIKVISVLAKFETSPVGSSLDNIFAEYQNFTVGHGLIMLAVDCVWLAVFGLYLELVMPKNIG